MAEQLSFVISIIATLNEDKPTKMQNYHHQSGCEATTYDVTIHPFLKGIRRPLSVSLCVGISGIITSSAVPVWASDVSNVLASGNSESLSPSRVEVKPEKPTQAFSLPQSHFPVQSSASATIHAPATKPGQLQGDYRSGSSLMTAEAVPAPVKPNLSQQQTPIPSEPSLSSVESAELEQMLEQMLNVEQPDTTIPIIYSIEVGQSSEPSSPSPTTMVDNNSFNENDLEPNVIAVATPSPPQDSAVQDFAAETIFSEIETAAQDSAIQDSAAETIFSETETAAQNSAIQDSAAETIFSETETAAQNSAIQDSAAETIFSETETASFPALLSNQDIVLPAKQQNVIPSLNQQDAETTLSSALLLDTETTQNVVSSFDQHITGQSGHPEGEQSGQSEVIQELEQPLAQVLDSELEHVPANQLQTFQETTSLDNHTQTVASPNVASEEGISLESLESAALEEKLTSVQMSSYAQTSSQSEEVEQLFNNVSPLFQSVSLENSSDLTSVSWKEASLVDFVGFESEAFYFTSELSSATVALTELTSDEELLELTSDEELLELASDEELLELASDEEVEQLFSQVPSISFDILDHLSSEIPLAEVSSASEEELFPSLLEHPSDILLALNPSDEEVEQLFNQVLSVSFEDVPLESVLQEEVPIRVETVRVDAEGGAIEHVETEGIETEILETTLDSLDSDSSSIESKQEQSVNYVAQSLPALRPLAGDRNIGGSAIAFPTVPSLGQSYNPSDSFAFRPLFGVPAPSPTPSPLIAKANLGRLESSESLLPVPVEGLPTSTTPWVPERNAPEPLAPPQAQHISQLPYTSNTPSVLASNGTPWLSRPGTIPMPIGQPTGQPIGQSMVVVIPNVATVPPTVQAWLQQYSQPSSGYSQHSVYPTGSGYLQPAPYSNYYSQGTSQGYSSSPAVPSWVGGLAIPDPTFPTAPVLGHISAPTIASSQLSPISVVPGQFAPVPPVPNSFGQPQLPPTPSPGQFTPIPGQFGQPQFGPAPGQFAPGQFTPIPGQFGQPQFGPAPGQFAPGQFAPAPGQFGQPQFGPAPGQFGPGQFAPAPGQFGQPQFGPAPGQFGPAPGQFGQPQFGQPQFSPVPGQFAPAPGQFGQPQFGPNQVSPVPTMPSPIAQPTPTIPDVTPRQLPVTDSSLTLQGGLVVLDDEFSGRARLSGVYPVSPDISLAGAVEVSEGTIFSDSELEGVNINELHLTLAPRDVPNLRLRVGQLDLTSYFDRSSFAKDALTHFLSPTLQTNPALAANGLGSRTGALVNYAITDNIDARTALFSSDRSINDFDLSGFAGELGFRTGNLIIRGTYVSAVDGGADDGPNEIFGFEREDGTVGLDDSDREESFGINAEVFIPDANLGVFGRYGRYENQDADFVADTFSGGVNFLDVFMPEDRLGLGYGRALSNNDLRGDRGDEIPDAWELFYDFRISPNIRAGVAIQQLNEFTETVAGFRVKTEFDVAP